MYDALATLNVHPMHPLNNAHLPLCMSCSNSAVSHQTAQEGSNLFGQNNANYPILETYAEGSVMEVKVVVSTYHWVSCLVLL